MILDETWREGLTINQQNLIVELFYAGNKLSPEVWKSAGYKSSRGVKAWLKTRAARSAKRLFAEMQFELDRDVVKAVSAKIIISRAFYNPFDIINGQGKLLPEHESDPKKMKELAHCIDGIETIVDKMGTKQVKVKLANKPEAIKMLSELFDFKGEKDEEEFDGKKSVHEMSIEERRQEASELIKKIFGVSVKKRIEKKRKGK